MQKEVKTADRRVPFHEEWFKLQREALDQNRRIHRLDEDLYLYQLMRFLNQWSPAGITLGSTGRNKVTEHASVTGYSPVLASLPMTRRGAAAVPLYA